jgi:hypothetical protein
MTKLALDLALSLALTFLLRVVRNVAPALQSWVEGLADRFTGWALPWLRVRAPA